MEIEKRTLQKLIAYLTKDWLFSDGLPPHHLPHIFANLYRAPFLWGVFCTSTLPGSALCPVFPP